MLNVRTGFIHPLFSSKNELPTMEREDVVFIILSPSQPEQSDDRHHSH